MIILWKMTYKRFLKAESILEFRHFSELITFHTQMFSHGILANVELFESTQLTFTVIEYWQRCNVENLVTGY